MASPRVGGEIAAPIIRARMMIQTDPMDVMEGHRTHIGFNQLAPHFHN
jgi:hypothetical protein